MALSFVCDRLRHGALTHSKRLVFPSVLTLRRSFGGSNIFEPNSSDEVVIKYCRPARLVMTFAILADFVYLATRIPTEVNPKGKRRLKFRIGRYNMRVFKIQRVARSVKDKMYSCTNKTHQNGTHTFVNIFVVVAHLLLAGHTRSSVRLTSKERASYLRNETNGRGRGTTDGALDTSYVPTCLFVCV